MNPISFLLTAQDQTSPAFQKVQQSMTQTARTADGVLAPAMAATQRGFAGVQASVVGLQGAYGQLLGLLGAASFIGLVRGANEGIDALGKFSAFTGVAVEDLSKLKYAAETAGPGWEAVKGGIESVFKASREAKAGNQEMLHYFKQLGISAKELRSLDVNQLLFRIADGMGELEEGTGKAELMLKLFKGNAEGMADYLGGGSRALKEAGDEAERFGLVVDQQAADAAGEFNNALDRLKAASSGLGIELSRNLVPALTALVTQLLEGKKASGGGWLEGLTRAVGVGIFGDPKAATKARLDNAQTMWQRLQEGRYNEKTGSTSLFSIPDATDMSAAGVGAQAVLNGTTFKEQLARNLAEAKALWAQMNAAPAQAPSANPSGSPSGSPGKPTTPQGRPVVPFDPSLSAASGQVVARGEDADALRLSQARYETAKAQLKVFLDTQKKSYADYYTELSKLELEQIENQRAFNAEEIKRQEQLKAAAKNAGEREAAQAKLNALRTDQLVLDEKAAQVKAQAAADGSAALERLQTQLAGITAQVAEQTGTYEDAARLKLEAQLGELDRLARLNGLNTNQIDALKALTLAAAQYRDIVQDLGKLERDQEARERAIFGEASSGRVSRGTADERAGRSRRDAAREQLPTAQRALDAAKSSGDKNAEAEAQRRVDELQSVIDAADSSVTAFYDRFEDRTADLIANLAKGFAGGFDSGIDAAEDLLKGFFNQFLQDTVNDASRAASQALRSMLFDSMGGGGGGGGLWGTIGSAIVGAFTGGGARAAGGLAEGWTLVGEHGPERVRLPRGSMVENTARTVAAARNGGQGAPAAPVHVHYHGMTNAHEIRRSQTQQAAMFMLAMRTAQRNT